MLELRKSTLFLSFGCLVALFLAACIKPYFNHLQYNKYKEPNFPYGFHIIGIDLGQSYSQIGVVRKDVFEIISDKQGRSVIPAYVSFSSHGDPLVGFEARAQAFNNPNNTVYDVRRLVGRTFSDPEVQEAIKELPYEIIDQDGQVKIRIQTNGEDKAVTPEEVLAMILQHLKITAEEYLNSTISYAVIAVPHNFAEKQRQATKDAGSIGGLEIIGIQNKSVSVGIAHHLDVKKYVGRQEEYKSIYIAYNTGDKEPELSLVSNDHGTFEVLNTMNDKSSRQNDFQGSKIEQQSILSPSRMIQLVEQLLSEAKVEIDEVDDIVLCGDPSHIIEAQRVLKSYFGKMALAPMGFSSDQAVVYGAAIQGYNLISEQQNDGCAGLQMDYTPLHLGIETSTGGFAKVIPRNYVIPIRKSIIVSTAEDSQENVTIRILESPQETAIGNRELGTIKLIGLPHMPKGVLEIDISFEIDIDQVLIVRAGWKGISEVEKLVVGVRGHTGDEIERLVALSDLPAEIERQGAVKDSVNLYNPRMA